MVALQYAAQGQVSLGEATGLVQVKTNLNITNMTVADFDGDHLLESVAYHSSGNMLRVEFGPEPTSWNAQALAQQGAPGGSLLHVRSGEVHGDGRADLLVWTDGAVSVLSGAEDLGQFHPTVAPWFPEPSEVLVLDLNADGLDDVIEADEVGQGSEAHVMVSDGAGSFQSVEVVAMSATGGLFDLLSADMDGDGIHDILTTSTGGAAHVAWGAGGAAFPSAQLVVAPAGVHSPYASVIHDGDLDGDLDLVQLQQSASNPSHSSLSAFANDGAGGFAPAGMVELGVFCHSMTTADLDQDGYDDLIIFGHIGAAANQVIIQPAASSPQEMTTLLVGSRNILAADVDCDGTVDLIAHRNGKGLTVALGEPKLGFPGPSKTPVGPVGHHGHRVATADVDNDGDRDLVLLDLSDQANPLLSPQLTTLLGDGQGQFEVHSQSPASGTPRDLTLGDVDGDGLIDAVIGAQGTSGNSSFVGLALAGAPGSFGQIQEHTMGAPVESVSLGDLDQDGDLDCVARSAVLLFDGGTFLAPQVYGSNSLGIGLGDMDGDGDLDVFRGDAHVALGDGLGGLLPWIQNVTSFGVLDLELGDLNLDGDLDAVGIWTTPFYNESLLMAVIGNGNGGVTAGQGFQSAPGPERHPPNLTDLDHDGIPDVLMAGDDSIDAWLGTGTGSFDGPHPLGMGAQSDVAVADVDSDGFPDLAFRLETDLRVLISRAPSLAPHSLLGSPKAGTFGEPAFKAYGTLQPDSELRLSLCNARPLATSHLVLGLSQLDAPFKGGVMVPLPTAILMGIPVDPDGSMAGTFDWPAGLPTGFELYLQFWIEDPAAWLGLSASNGLRSVTP
jgi:hypothetical protein